MINSVALREDLPSAKVLLMCGKWTVQGRAQRGGEKKVLLQSLVREGPVLPEDGATDQHRRDVFPTSSRARTTGPAGSDALGSFGDGVGRL